MDIGAEFDDDFFEKPKERERNLSSNYEPKVCVPLWYMESDNTGREASDILLALKHQADFHYFSHNYSKAAETYENCLQLVPPSNNTWKREFMENLARSLLHLEESNKALEWSLKLYESSFSADQKVVSMNLLATVCHKLGKYQEELEALHYCIEVHKSCPEFWLRLGLCYAGLFKINLPGCSVLKSRSEDTENDQEPCCAFNSKSCHIPQQIENGTGDMLPSTENAVASSSSSLPLTDECSKTETETTSKCDICALGVNIVSSCLIHTRVLLDSGGPYSLGMERDERIREKIASSLTHMEVDQSFIDIASEMLGLNFLAELQENKEGSIEQDDLVGKLKQLDKTDV